MESYFGYDVQESPSLRGSGLKLLGGMTDRKSQPSPSLRGSGLKFPPAHNFPLLDWSPSLRGSGLKWHDVGRPWNRRRSLPLYEGVD